jgi:hypothetical protein
MFATSSVMAMVGRNTSKNMSVEEEDVSPTKQHWRFVKTLHRIFSLQRLEKEFVVRQEKNRSQIIDQSGDRSLHRREVERRPIWTIWQRYSILLNQTPIKRLTRTSYG